MSMTAIEERGALRRADNWNRRFNQQKFQVILRNKLEMMKNKYLRLGSRRRVNLIVNWAMSN